MSNNNETRSYYFNKTSENEFESWEIIHNNRGGYTESELNIKYNKDNHILLIKNEHGNWIYFYDDQVEWLRDILNEIDLDE